MTKLRLSSPRATQTLAVQHKTTQIKVQPHNTDSTDTVIVQTQNYNTSTDFPPLALRPPRYTVKRTLQNKIDSKETTLAYRKLLLLQKNPLAPKLRVELDNWLLVHQPRIQNKVFKMEPGKPIPLEIMKLFVIYLKRFGINIDSPYTYYPNKQPSISPKP